MRGVLMAMFMGTTAIGAAHANGDVLAPGNWDPTNRAVLERWLEDVAKRPAKPRKVAAFDFDNTCIFHDCGEATFRFQLDQLRFRLTPAQMGEVLPTEWKGVTALRAGESLADVRADILAAYEQLWPQLQMGELDAARGTDAHKDFRVKLLWLYDEAYATPGIGADWAYPVLGRFLAGHTYDEVKGLAREAVRAALAEEPGRGAWESATPGKTGARKHGFLTGLRPQPEMIDLIEALKKAGVESFVVSASVEPIVEGTCFELGYPLDDAHVFGIRIALDAQDRLTLQEMDRAEYPLTYRPGKVELIKKLIGAEPLLVAGDTFTDYEMLTGFPATEVALFINRNQVRGELAALYKEGLAGGERVPGPGKRRVILQGRDEPEGRFRQGLLTVPLGEKAPRPIE